ncbi:Synaptotagmin-C, partial [Xenotaenia resolanae]
VHRKTLNPVFNETFQFGVPLNELHSRKLHFSVYDFDRFSRHDLIGQVVVDNLLEFSEGSGDKPIWRDIVEGTAEKADLGELNFSLCYLPTAGRLTATVIKATNLKAMDLTGFSALPRRLNSQQLSCVTDADTCELLSLALCFHHACLFLFLLHFF